LFIATADKQSSRIFCNKKNMFLKRERFTVPFAEILFTVIGHGGFSHGLWPWKYLREGGAINQ
jgi:hypothetical protein